MVHHHDIDLTEDFVPVGEVTMPGEFIPLFVSDPADEMPLGTMIPMLRSRFEYDSDGVAQQINQITSYIDASNIYGSVGTRTASLRAGFGGLLLTSDGSNNLSDGSGDFLPLNTLGLENAAPPTTGTGVAVVAEDLFVAGDIRSNDELRLLEDDGAPVADDSDVLGASVENGQVDLGEAFFNPQLVTQFGIEPYLKGLSEQQIQEIDPLIVDGVRNLLFDPPAAVDLGATNLQRGRDHGLPDYNQARVDYGLDPMSEIAAISSDTEVVRKLEAAYDAAGDGVDGYQAVNNIDVFAGAISEDHIPGGSVGQLLQAVLVDQFTRLRDGDRFFYENVFSGSTLNKIQDTRLSDIIRRNTDLETIGDEVFRGDNVLTYRGREADGRLDIALLARRGHLEVIDRRSQRVLAVQKLADTAIVTIYGTSRQDQILVDASVAESWDGVVELHGGGGTDRLKISGTNSSDEIEVTAAEVRINDLSLFYGNFEKLTVDAAGGNDRAVVSQPPSSSVTLAGGDGDDQLIGSDSGEVLRGGRERDLLIGGFGQDMLLGGPGQDLLVSEKLDGDAEAIASVWVGSQSFRERVETLEGIASSIDDEAKDILFGGLGRDWRL